eukprot:11185818-Lingulodinium_polyedra.AAC.1
MPGDRSSSIVWDLWLTDYDPNFWSRAFGECPLTIYGGKELCSSPGVEDFEDLAPRCSMLSYHGTGAHS